MNDVYKLLILGGGYSTVDVVKSARALNLDKPIKIYVTSNSNLGEAKLLADESVLINTSDYNKLSTFIQQNHIDGIMTGASEFHILNMIRLCHLTNLPSYATEEQWKICQNKHEFKNLCKKYNVPVVPEFSINEDPQTYEYPIIVKPVDGCSARGISVCDSCRSFEFAKNKALSYSKSKKIIIEKFIENKGCTISVRYIAVDGEIYLEAVGDRYVLDSDNGKALITAAAFYPSKYTDFYIEHIDKNVVNMFKGLGLKNGVLFMEAIANSAGIFFYEMGLRISGGMTYKITEFTNGVNELKMLIRHALTGRMCDVNDINKINPYLNNYFNSSITIPLKVGKIAKIEGIEKIKENPHVFSITQYYHVGDNIEPKYIGTLDQLFARITIIVEDKFQLSNLIYYIISNLSIKDELDNEMFISSKLQKIYEDYIKK